MNVVITGAGKGIGYALALKFAENANNKIIAISRDTSELEKLNKSNIVSVSGNLSDIHNGITPLLKRIYNEFQVLDILVNNAGILDKSDFENIDLYKAKEMFEVNFFAPVVMIKELLPLFSARGNAHIVNIGSMGGVQESIKFKGLSLYSASKAAISVLTECLAVELKEKNISCNCLALGSVQTNMFENAFPGLTASVSPEKMADYIFDFAVCPPEGCNGKIIKVVFNNF